MSRETSEWLNTRILVGFTDKRGHAWHYKESDQGVEPNHYAGAIPIEDVQRRLFDFKVESSPLYVCIDGDYQLVPGRQAMTTSDTHEVLGMFTDGYVGHDYSEWLLTTVANILDDSLSIGSAGLLRNRAQAFVQVEVPENFSTNNGVEFRPNLLACTSFDGSLATTYKRVVTITVCDNTLASGLSENGQVFKAKHSKNSGMKLSNARDALQIITTMADEITTEIDKLIETEVSEKVFAALLDSLVPVPTVEDGTSTRGATMAETKRDTLTSLWRSDLRVAPWRGTAFGALQAFNTYNHHEAIVRKVSRAERNLENALNGTTAASDSEVLSTLATLLAN